MEREAMIRRFHEIYGDDGGRIRVFSAPGRVNLIGEHTDYNGGHVFPCALSMAVYGAVRIRADRAVRVFSANMNDGIHEFSLDDELHVSDEDGWTNYVKGVFHVFKESGYVLSHGLELFIDSDLPPGVGLSSSAALEVLVGMILREMFDLEMSLEEVAVLGQKAENDYVGMKCGIMDQFVCAMGRKDYAILLNTEQLQYEYVPLKLKDAKIVITNSGVRHSHVTSAYNTRRIECEKALKKLKVVNNIKNLCDLDRDRFESSKDVIMNDVYTKRARHVVYEDARTIRAVSTLRVGNLKRFGDLMNASHKSLRDDYEVSCPELDFLAEEAWKIDGVIGSRMTGGGFGGCTVSIVKEDAIDRFCEKIREAYRDRFGIEAEFYIVSPEDGVRELF